MIDASKLRWLVYGFLAVIVAVVFQQIYTSMTEQGIASGGPYNNGAAYPRTVAIAIGVLVLCQMVVDFFAAPAEPSEDAPTVEMSDIRRAGTLLLIFAIYLGLLKTLGYHLTTAPMVFAIMWTCGARNLVRLVISALLLAFVFAYIFEKFLNVVLPGGVFALNIPW